MRSLKSLRAEFPQYGDVSDGDFLFAIRERFYPDVHPRTFFDSVEGAANAHVTIKKYREKYRADVQKPIDGETTDATARRLGGALEATVGDPGGAGMKAARAGFQGMTFGAGDEIVAGATSLLRGTDYGEELARERGRLEIGRDQNPVLSTVAEVGGAVALPGAVVTGAKARPIATAAKSAGLGGIAAGTYGFNSGEGGFRNRLDDAQVSAVVGAGLGAAAPFAGGLLERAANSRLAERAQAALPDFKGMRRAAGNVYESIDNAPVPSAGLPKAVSDLQDSFGPRPINPRIMPKTSGLIDDLTDIATDPRTEVPFGELKDMRRLAGDVAGGLDKTDAMGGARVKGAIDEFIEQASPEVAKQAKRADEMWSQLSRSEAIQEVIDKARRQASGFENGLRIGFRGILNSKKKRAKFSKAEIAAMEQIVEGTAFGNMMKKVGRLGFGMGQQTNVLSGLTAAGAAGGLGVAALGPAGLLLGSVPGVMGAAGKKLSEKSTSKLADALRYQTISGGSATPQISVMGRGILDELARRSSQGQAAAGLPGILTQQ